MARPLRIEFQDALYHITSRGNEKRDIFLNNRDRESFLELLSLVIERFDWVCHAYILMDNHYHLMIETRKGILSRAVKKYESTKKMKNRKRKMLHCKMRPRKVYWTSRH